MTTRIIDDFLSVDTFNRLNAIVNSFEFPWSFSPYVANSTDDSDYHTYHTHIIYSNYKPVSDFWFELDEFLLFLQPKAMIKVKINSYPRTAKIYKHGIHVDQDYPHKGALFYFNDNDGVTTMQDGTEIESKANRLVLFDSALPHCSSSCTNSTRRLTMNFNYL
jgi:hypothetical protein